MRNLPWAIHGVYATIGAIPRELILMLGRGEITRRGVVAVASLDNCKEILKRVSARGHILSEKIERVMVL
jgi:hypothetical protein